LSNASQFAVRSHTKDLPNELKIDIESYHTLLAIAATPFLTGIIYSPSEPAPTVRVETFKRNGHTLHRSAFDRFVEAVRAAAD
jgi:hypothetical protein